MENTATEQTTGEATADIIVSQEPSNQGETGKSILGEVAPSETELMGIEDTGAKPKEEQEGGEEAKAEESEADTPPAGYVPHAALHEGQLQRQYLAQEVDNLRQELATIKGKADEPEEGFKVLSDEEFDELAEDDPVEAVKYQRALRKHEEKQYAEGVKRQADENQFYQDQGVINQGIERMEKAVPGLHEEGNSINQDLGQFAVENGFDPDYLSALTSPSTLILPSGAKNAVLLGDGAASLVQMIHELYKTGKKHGSVKIRTKGSGPGKIGGTITDIPEGSLTEADYAKMSSAEREKILGG